MTLKDLNIGETAVVGTVGGEGALRQHFLDMGLIPGEEVTLVKFAPMGDPMELSIHGYELTLRLDDAARIGVTLAKAPAAKKAAAESEKPVEHPGLGEGGRYHTKKGENPLPDDTTLTFALAGNQNCGKTTLFNQLTGSNQHVGNFPGVTVDRKSGAIRNNPNTEVTDLPGIYSMSPYTSEEIVTRQFIIGEKPTGIINIVDATNIERNLYLTMQLMELDTPMVLALNMMDEVRSNGGSIDVQKMSQALGIPIVPISAAKGEGVSELVDQALTVARSQTLPKVTDFCADDSAVHRCIHAVVHLIADHADRIGVPARFCAAKLIEGGDDLAQSLALDENERELLEHCIVQMENETGRRPQRGARGHALHVHRGRRGCFRGQVPREQGARALHEDRSHPHRQIYRPADVSRRDVPHVLSHVQRHRPVAVRPAAARHRRADRRRGRRAHGLRHQPRGT